MVSTKFCLVVLSISLGLFGCDSFSTSYRYERELHPNSYTLYWNPPTDEGEICFAVSVRTSGWVGFGFSPNGDMINSDVVMGWVRGGQVFFSDRFATERALPPVDSEQNYRLISGVEQNGNTSFEFCRKLRTCDDRDRDLVVGTTRVIYSWNPEDPADTPLQHTTRGSRSVNLLSEPAFAAALPSDTQTIAFVQDNVTIPSVETTYWCRTFSFQQPASKRHIIRIGIDLAPASAEYVHHMLLYACNDQLPPASGTCSGDTSPFQSVSCRSLILAAWAVGGVDFDFPPETGIPIGPEETFRTFLLEMHYNNPNRVAGVVDSSGFTFYHTGEVRTHDASVLSVGNFVSPQMVIPPFASSYVIQGYCPAECTREHFSTDIQVFASVLHSHLAGSSMWTQLIRNGAEIGTVDRNLDYDFDFQDQIYFDPPITIKPGDELIVNCQYKTVEREQYTLGGESTQEEMCLHFLFYYPRVELQSCKSIYDLTVAYSTAAANLVCAEIIPSPTALLNASLVNWSDKVLRTLEVSPLTRPNTVYAYCDRLIQTKLPIPGVDYQIQPNRWDECNSYNGTYYIGQNQDYYRCGQAPYVPNISTTFTGPTGSAVPLSLISTLFMMSLLVQALNAFT